MNALVGAQFNMFDTFEQTLKNCFKFLKAAQLTYDFEFLILYAESCVFLTSQSLLTNHEISVNESSEQNIFKILNEKFKFESYHWLFLLNKNSLNVCQWAAATERDYLKPYLEKINGLSWPTINKRVADYALQAGYISASEKYYRKEHDYNAQFLSEAIIRGNIDMLHGLVSHLSQKLNIKQDQFFSSEQVICLYFSSKELLANLISTFFVNQNILLNCQTESVEFLIYLEAHGWNVNMKVDIEQDILLTTLNELLKMEQQGGICSNITFLLPDFLASERSNYKLRTKKNILKKDKYGFTILHFMACLNVINSKPFMLKYCNLADMNQVVSKSFLGDNYTPIELAILKQNNFFLKGLLDMKFNFNKPGLHGVKYIELAILNGRYESVKFLIDEANIDIDSQFLNTHSVFKKTIFHYAVGDAISDEKAAMRIIKLLIKRTKFPARLAALLIKLDDQDNSVLGIATSQKKDKIVRFILDYVRRYVPKELDTLILKANNRGYNSISFALDNQNLSILKELFENITDKKKFYEKSYNKYINIAKRTNNKDITSFILKQVLDYKKMKKAKA